MSAAVHPRTPGGRDAANLACSLSSVWAPHDEAPLDGSAGRRSVDFSSLFVDRGALP